jgi:signal transduction histidine kinase
LSFIDTGIGIPDFNLKLVWNNFFTTKENGSGLGLAICKRIIESDHRGKISIKSKKNHGTAVNIILPILQTQTN